MNIYIYGIIDFNEEIEEAIIGLNGTNVYNIPYRNIGALVSDFDKTIPIRDEDHVLEHETVVEKMMRNFTILPMRFLTVFDKKDNVLSMLNEHYSDFQEDLDRLRNKVEFGIKVIWPGAIIRERIENAYKKAQNDISSSADSPGKSFMKEKFGKYKIDKEFEEEADRCIAIIDGFFNRFVAEKRLEKLKTDNLLLDAAYLVDKEKQDDLKRAFEELKTSPCDLKYLFSGPWPPYNFVTLLPSADYKKSKKLDASDKIFQHEGSKDAKI